jgi:cysteine desulfurase/selenocysteine lyase
MAAPRVRDDFALLKRELDGGRLVYLDSAASSIPPDQVLEAEHRCRRTLAANVHRGRHVLSEEATAAYAAARARVARFLGAESRSVVFVRGTTEAINLVARGLRLTKEDRVLVTAAEHHSNIAPWMREATVTFVGSDPLRPVDPAVLRTAINELRPKVLAIHHASNVTGVVQPVADLCKVARELDVITMVDAAQSAPHRPLDVRALGCDFLAFSGHKTLGPKGIGVLWGRFDLLSRLEPLVVGGGAVQTVSKGGFALRPPPEGLEAGTPNVAGAVALAAAMDYLERVGWEWIAAHGRTLVQAFRDATRSLPFARMLLPESNDGVPIASFVLAPGGINADQLAITLSDSCSVMVRSGLLCAHVLFEEIGAPQGALRASAYLYNEPSEVHAFADACARVLHRMGS